MEDLADQETKYPSNLLQTTSQIPQEIQQNTTQRYSHCANQSFGSGLCNSRNIKHVSFPNLNTYTHVQFNQFETPFQVC